MGMAGSLTHDIIKGPPPPPIERGWGGDGSEGRGANRRASFTGLFVLLAASVMVFAAFTSAFVVRRGLSDDWTGTAKPRDRKSTRLNSSHTVISYAVFCLKKKKKQQIETNTNESTNDAHTKSDTQREVQ